jgi:hypothetical protein
MTRLLTALAAVWDFVVGDDWRAALGVVISLGFTALLADSGVGAWWVMPVAVIVLLGWSIRRAAREDKRR